MWFISRISLTFIYVVTLIFTYFMGLFRRHPRYHRRIIINGTFHNPNWFHAHIEPIVRSGYGEVVLITDEPIAQLDGLTYACPPAWLNNLITRAGAKFIWTLWMGIRKPADIYIGYHIFPSAITALIAAKAHGAKVCYQVTSGQLEIEGGGFQAENKLLSGLGSFSPLIQKLTHSIIKQFDLVIVRGRRAEQYIREQARFDNKLEIVTGSVLTDERFISAERDIDVIFVGRLVEYKRPEKLLEVIHRLALSRPNVKAKIVGDGELKKSLERFVNEHNISANVEFLGKVSDVTSLVSRSKVIMLTSRWEGVSIAMLEAMALGVVPVVTDVGDLSDYVINDKTGFIHNLEDLEGMKESVDRLLGDSDLRNRLSMACRALVMQTSDREVLSKRWGIMLDNLSLQGEQ